MIALLPRVDGGKFRSASARRSFLLYCLDDARAVARLGECASSDSRAKLEGCRGFRLNGWQRIGIVLSVVWAIVGGLWGMKQAVAPAWRQFNACMSLPNVDVKVSEEIKK
jgi:hypothetical protein